MTQRTFPPTKPLAHIFTEARRHEVHHFADCPASECPYDLFCGFLSQETHPSQIQQPKDVNLKNFVEVATHISHQLNQNNALYSSTIEFRCTQHFAPGGHTTRTECKPDITGAFVPHFRGTVTTKESKIKYRPPTWPQICLTGEDASKGKSEGDQLRQGETYVRYLIQARPDLYVVQGVFVNKSVIVFILGVAGQGICKLPLRWKEDQEEVINVLTLFIYRLYKPGDWAVSAVHSPTIHQDSDQCTWTIRVSHIEGQVTDYPGFRHIHANAPYSTRTNIFVNDTCEVAYQGKRIPIVKLQMDRNKRRFREDNLLDIIHGEGKEPVTGIVQALFSVNLEASTALGGIWASRLTALDREGKRFLTAPTLLDMLQLAYDTLESLRFIRFNRQILHHDISPGNVLYTEETRKSSQGGVESGAEGPKEPAPCYVRYFLKKSNDPLETNALLIDFNYGEQMEKGDGRRIIKTGTPGYIARAAEINSHWPHGNRPLGLAGMPEAPEVYIEAHRERAGKFVSQEDMLIKPHLLRQQADLPRWRHELEHDVESVFWLIVNWLSLASPEGKPKQPIKRAHWAVLHGKAASRHLIVPGAATGCYHEFFRDVQPLLDQLTDVLLLDPAWLKDDNHPRKQPDYAVEVFQRSILGFLLKHGNADWMKHSIEGVQRELEFAPDPPRASTTTTSKRKNPAFESQELPAKRSRLDAAGTPASGVDGDAGVDRDNDDNDNDDGDDGEGKGGGGTTIPILIEERIAQFWQNVPHPYPATP